MMGDAFNVQELRVGKGKISGGFWMSKDEGKGKPVRSIFLNRFEKVTRRLAKGRLASRSLVVFF